MMHGHEKSDPEIVAIRTNAGGMRREKPTNKAVPTAAELVERRAGTEGNAGQQSTLRAQDRAGVSQALERIRQAARHNKKERFTALLHHVNPETLRLAFNALKKDAAPGVDGTTWSDYEVDLERRLEELHDRVHRGAYRPQPSRRVYIPKADGRQRPLAVAAVEDKIVQGAVAMVLSAIYEVDFLGFSYGFRPGRGQHDALDALVVGISSRKVNWILDADIRSFFDMVDRKWMIRFVEHRIGDPRIIRLIRKWMKAGVLEDGDFKASERGTGQGSVISPLLANIYLHYAFDLWANRWRQREATGDMIILRYADDTVVGFEHEAEGKPETFNFLGFTFICSKSRKGRFLIIRKTRRDRMMAKLLELKEEMRRRMHWPISEQGEWLKQVVGGFFNYHAVPTNSRALAAFRHHVRVLWGRTLRRRSQKDRTTWDRIAQLAEEWLPKPRILHPWPNVRFAVRHPR